jgi:thiamine-monophosphate kinase
MTTRGLAEREIIAILRKQFDTKPNLPLGFDEDVAALQSGKNELVILKSDMLVGKTDIPPGMTLKQAARKAVVATVSDFAAKGVQPKALLTGLGLASPVSRESVNQLAQGLSGAAREYGCRIIGGDTSQTDDLIIDCIGFGVAEKSKILRRDGATPDDIVATTGDFGKTSAGLRILAARNRQMIHSFPSLVRSVLHPVARLSIGIKLAKTRKVTASIDSSDGLAWSLHEIARLSNVDIVLDNIPVARETLAYAKTNRISPDNLALFGGEEYELVLTIKSSSFGRLKGMFPSLRRIGTVNRGSGEVRARIGNKVRRVEPRGYQHFAGGK